MKLLLVKMDTKSLMKTLNNTINYSYGFFDGVEMSKSEFFKFLAGYTAEALDKYIDARARVNPQALHHVYEPNMVGSPKGRLFKFSVRSTQYSISFKGVFLPSSGIPSNTTMPFVDKAEIMESGISLTIEPKNSDVLVFEDDGETVFVRKSIFVQHPGGDQVAGSFGKTVDSFFDSYFTNALLQPIINRLQTPDDFSRNFSSGAKGGRSVGVRAGRKYFNMSGVVVE